MRKKIALILTSIMLAATFLTGCGEKDISGEYTTTVNATDLIDESTTSYLSGMGIDISSLTLDVKITLDSEHNYEIQFDPTNFKTGFSEIVTANMQTILDNILTSEGLSRAELTDVRAQFLGYESADAFWADLTTQLTESLNTQLATLDDKYNKETITGTYEVTKDSVTFTTNEDSPELTLNSATINEDDSITLEATTDTGVELTLSPEFKATEEK